MTELSGNAVRMLSAEPALLPGQRAIHQVHRELMGGAPYYRTAVEYSVLGIEPAETREALQSIVPDMFVADGEVLLPDRHLNLYPMDAGRFPRIRPGVDAAIGSVSISTCGVYFEKKRRFDASRELEFTGNNTLIINFGDEILVEWLRKYEWNGHVGITFWHEQEDEFVGERLTVETHHGRTGVLPTVASSVGVFNGDSYTHYQHSERQAWDDEEVMAFLALVRQLDVQARIVQ